METLTDLLNWLTSEGGALILVAWAISWGLEGWARWEVLSSKVKSLAILGVAVVLGCLAVWLQSQPALVARLSPYGRLLITIVSMWLTTQTAHRLDSLRKRGAKAGLPASAASAKG